MATKKIMGIETEFGIMVRGAKDWNPISASSLLINSYMSSLDNYDGVKISWDFTDESPANDARAFNPNITSTPPEVESHLVNAVLTNGSRYYVDHAHPEMSSPECTNALDIVKYDRAGELIMIDSMEAASKLMDHGEQIIIYKDNSDRKGNSYGCHENYLLDRSVPFSDIVSVATTHFVSRQIFIGSGKVGSEKPGEKQDDVSFQITQRADHFEAEVGLETTVKRPIVNTRDEPHADSSKYRRLHVIAGDANLCQVATLLKVGTSAIIFSMLEDSYLDDIPIIENPLQAMWLISRDLNLNQPISLIDGKKIKAIDVQWYFLTKAREWSEQFGLESVGEEAGKLVLERWEQVLTSLEKNPKELVGQIDWITKKYLLDGFRERHNCEWSDERLRALDLQYHDLRPNKSLAKKAGLEEIFSDEEARKAIKEPPHDTRAYFRGKCLSKFPRQIVSANWDSIVFDIGDQTLHRVPMLEPTKGTADHVEELLDSSATCEELLTRLGR